MYESRNLNSVIEVFKDCSIKFVYLEYVIESPSYATTYSFKEGDRNIAHISYCYYSNEVTIKYFPAGNSSLVIPSKMIGDYAFLEQVGFLIKRISEEFPFE